MNSPIVDVARLDCIRYVALHYFFWNKFGKSDIFCCGECEDEEAKNDGNSLGHIKHISHMCTHGEDDRHADHVVDGVEHTGENHQNMV